MTQPDQYTPTGAWNADSFAELAAKTEEDWMADITGRTSGPFEKFRTGLFGDLAEDLQDGLSTAAAFLTQIARGLLGDLEQTWDNVEDIIADIVDGVPDKLTEHTEAIANLNTIAAAMDSTAAYVGDLQDMVTVPRSQLTCWGGAAQASIDILTPFLIVGGGFVKVNCLPVFYPNVTPLASTGDIYYTPIIVDRVGDVGKIRWIVGADTSVFSIDYYEIALCAYNPNTGDIEKVWGSGDITSAEADSSTLTEVEIDMALTGQSVTPGQILFVAHQQVAPGLLQAPRAFAAVPQGDIARPSGLLDGACYVAPAYSTGIPSSIALSSLDKENRLIPWAAVTVDS